MGSGPVTQQPAAVMDDEAQEADLVSLGTGAEVRSAARPTRPSGTAESAPLVVVDPAPAAPAILPGEVAVSEPREVTPEPVPAVPAAHLRDPSIPRTIQRLDKAKKGALAWLVEQQQPDGSWLGPGRSRDGLEQPEVALAMRLRVTALALHALTVNLSTEEGVPMAAAADRASSWILSLQDEKTGSIGTREGPGAVLDHALATYALGEQLARVPSEAGTKGLEAALDYLAGLKPADVFTVPAGRDEVEAWRLKALKDTTPRLRALFNPKTRQEQLKLTQNFTNWRYLIYNAYGQELGAHDGFAALTRDLSGTSRSRNAEWVDQQLDEFLSRDESGAFDPDYDHHEPIGRTGATALFGIALGIVREGLF